MKHLPQAFIKQMESLLKDDSKAFFESLEKESTVSIRLNAKKLGNVALHLDTVDWAQQAYYLPQRPYFTYDPLLHAGAYYVQEASSMFIDTILRQHCNENTAYKILDVCAAPGGKTHILSSFFSEESIIVANEHNRKRAEILKENVIKWGAGNVLVTQNEAADFSKFVNFFDVILLDAPCSGEGLFRKDAKSIDEWSPNAVQQCSIRQQKIIDEIWPCLKPGGLLIYSTCTYNPVENEGSIAHILNKYKAQSLPITNSSNNFPHEKIGDFYSYHFYPHNIKGEGFFVSLIKKNNADFFEKKISKQTDKNITLLPKDVQVLLSKHLLNKHSFSFYQFNNQCIAVNKAFELSFLHLSQSLRIVYPLLNLGEFAHQKFIPAHALALSQHINKENFITIELDYKKAILFLKRQHFPLDCEPGKYIVQYKQVALGWINVLPNRFNNLYPMEWRILHDAKVAKTLFVLDELIK